MRTEFRSAMRTRALAGLVVLAALTLSAPSARARRAEPFAARAGVELATAAALSWAPDAYLVYVENDEEVDTGGGAGRWGYLFYSPSRDKARGWSVRGGKLIVAEDLPMHLEAPPVTDPWIDSDAALAAAEDGARKEFKHTPGARLASMLLMRGPFAEGDPDQTTWTLVYTSPGAPSLFVVLDAADGKVRRVWRG